MTKIIFLDIDGVLNRYVYLGAPSTISMIEPELAGRLNKILLFTGAKLVISSTWRRLIMNGHYDLRGFGHMLKTHGVTAADVIGHTGDDGESRGEEIRAMLRNTWQPYRPTHAILDDDSDGMDFHGNKFIKIDSRHGLQDAHVERAIELLGKE